MGIMDELEKDLREAKGRAEQKYDDVRETFHEELEDHRQKQPDDVMDWPHDDTDHAIL